MFHIEKNLIVFFFVMWAGGCQFMLVNLIINLLYE